MTYERKIWVMSSIEWRNYSTQGSTYAGTNQSIGDNIAWNRVPMIKSGVIKGHSGHYYTNNSNPNTVYVNIAGVNLMPIIWLGTTGAMDNFSEESFSAGDNMCLVNIESSFSTSIMGYSCAMGVFD